MALERLLQSGAARLTDDVGDGVWTSALEIDSDSDKVVAGLVWFCLGSPHVGDRWRAAHAVRTLARFGRWQVIDALFSCLTHPAPGLFSINDCRSSSCIRGNGFSWQSLEWLSTIQRRSHVTGESWRP